MLRFVFDVLLMAVIAEILVYFGAPERTAWLIACICGIFCLLSDIRKTLKEK